MKPRKFTITLWVLILSVLPNIAYSANQTWKGDGEEETLWTTEGVWSGGDWAQGDVPTFGNISGRSNQTVLIEGDIQIGGGMTISPNAQTEYVFKGQGINPSLNFTGRINSHGKIRYEDITLKTTEFFYITGGGSIDAETNSGSDYTIIGKGTYIETTYFSLSAAGNQYGNLILDGGKVFVAPSNGEARMGNYASTYMSNFTINSGEFKTTFLNLGGSNGSSGSKLTFTQSGGVVIADKIRMGNPHVDNVVKVDFLGGRWEVGVSGINSFDSKVEFNVENGEYYASATHNIIAGTKANLLAGGTMAFGATSDSSFSINWLGTLTGEGGISVQDNITLNLTQENTYTGTTYINETGLLNVGANGALGSGTIVVQGGILDIAQYKLNNSLVTLAENGLIQNGGTNILNFSIKTEKEGTLTTMEVRGMQLQSIASGNAHFESNNQILLSQGSHWVIGEGSSKNIMKFTLSTANLTGGTGGNQAFIMVDDSSSLTLSGHIGLDLSTLDTHGLNNGGTLTQFCLIGVQSGDYSTWSASHLNVTGVRGIELFLDAEGLSWASSYASLDELKQELMSSGTISLVMSPSINMLVNDGSASYIYGTNGQRYGAAQEGVIFSGKLTLDSSIVPVYGFSLADNKAMALTAHSFQVDTQLTDQNGKKTGVEISGDAGKDRTVTFSHRANSFTGDLSVSYGKIAIHLADSSSGLITTLGVNNTIHLNSESTLTLDLGIGNYRLENDLMMNNAQVSLINKTGEVTWAGDIFINSSQTVKIENQSSDALTLEGNLSYTRAESNLEITSYAGKGEVILSGKENSLNKLTINGSVYLQGEENQEAYLSLNALQMNSGLLIIENGVLSIDSSFNSTSDQSVTLQFKENSTLEFKYAATWESNVSLDISNSSKTKLKTGGFPLLFKGRLLGSGEMIKEGNSILEFAGDSSLFEGAITISEGGITISNGYTLKAGSLKLSNNTSLKINGDIDLTDSLTLGDNIQFKANFENKSFDIHFGKNNTLETLIIQQAGSISLGQGSTIKTSVTKPGLVGLGAISTKNGGSIDLNGITISGGATNELNWDVETVSFVLMTADGGFTTNGGELLTSETIDQVIQLSNGGLWNNFLNGKLYLEGNHLMLDLTRNAETIQPYAKTDNQKIMAVQFDYMINHANDLQLVDTRLGEVLDKLSSVILKDNVATIMDTLGGLSYSQMMDAQRLDMMRHTETVRQRAYFSPTLQQGDGNDFWFEGTQDYRKIRLDEESCGFTQSSWGGGLGFSLYAGEKFNLGFACAYNSIELTSDDFSGKTESDAYYADIYANYQSGPWVMTMVLSSSSFSHDAERKVSGISQSADGLGKVSTDGSGFIGQFELGYAISIPESTNFIMPVIGFTAGYTDLDAFKETGLDNMSLQVSPEKMNLARLSAGIRFVRTFEDEYEKWNASRFEWRLMVIQDLTDSQYKAETHFQGISALPFNIKGNNMKSTTFQMGISFIDVLDEGWSWFGDLNGEFSDAYSGIYSSLGLKYSF